MSGASTAATATDDDDDDDDDDKLFERCCRLPTKNQKESGEINATEERRNT